MLPQTELLLVASAAFGAVVLYGPWQSACTAYFRQPMFEQRDRLTKMVAAGRLSPDDDAFKLVRSAINGQIRYAHRASFPRLIAHVMFSNISDEPVRRVMTAIEQCPLDVATELLEIRKRCALALFALIFFKSPVLMLTGLFIAAYVIFRLGAGTLLPAHLLYQVERDAASSDNPKALNYA